MPRIPDNGNPPPTVLSLGEAVGEGALAGLAAGLLLLSLQPAVLNLIGAADSRLAAAIGLASYLLVCVQVGAALAVAALALMAALHRDAE